MFQIRARREAAPPPPSVQHTASCGHSPSEERGTCPSCQRAKAARLRAQEVAVAPSIVLRHQ